jgi:hypothetical protein
MVAPTPLSELFARVAPGEGSATLHVPDDWLQGRTLFGGLQAAVGLAAMRTVAPPSPLRSLQPAVAAARPIELPWIPGGVPVALGRQTMVVFG